TTQAADGRRILVGWMGLPDISYPSDMYNWAHALTLPRELTLQEGRLKQLPVRELDLLRKRTIYAQSTEINHAMVIAQAETFELDLSNLALQTTQFEIHVRAADQEATVLTYDAMTQRFTLDRSRSGAEVPAVDYGTTRTVQLEQPLHQLRLFVDRSSIEIFLNDGEAVASTRIFPKSTSQDITLIGDLTADIAIYEL
ncbi:MAG: GH32 C-terminal domain-containing protein, partial [Exiguobacterium oxidotolerans]